MQVRNVKKDSYQSSICYCGSFKTRKIYEEIRRDMEQAHLAVGLPLKDTWTSEDTEPGVTKRLGLPYGFFMMLGFVWDLIRNMLSPQDYLNLYGKNRGKSKGPTLSDMSETSLAPLIIRQALSRLAAQLYDRSGRLLGPAITTMKVLLSSISRAG